HDVPEVLLQAIVAAEDKRFWRHQGADWLARMRAAWSNLINFKVVRGASTISEQVVRMLRPRPRTIWNRWLEGWEARLLEKQLDKASILEFYINQIPFTSNKRGVSQAADYYFDRDLSTLNHKEALALAVFIRAPSILHPDKNPKLVERRIEILANRMYEEGRLNDSEFRVLQLQKLKTNIQRKRVDSRHFARFVLEQNPQAHGEINTSLDLAIQNKASAILNTQLKKLQASKVQNAALLLVDHLSNEILAWVVAGESELKRGGSAYNAVLTPRQPGSTLKPFIYARALEEGVSAAQKIDDMPLTESVGTGQHNYRNYSRHYYGPISLREALGNSLNTPAIRVMRELDFLQVVQDFSDLGFSNLQKNAHIYGDGIALGNGEVSLFELVQAYTVIARRGVYYPLNGFRQTTEPASRVFSEETASLIANILSDAAAREKEFGRNSVLNLPFQTAVKTGTSNDYHDAWIVGFNDRFTLGVWMGNMDYQAMKNITGSRGPAPVFRSVMNELNRHRHSAPLFLSKKLQRKEVCIDNGSIKQTQNCNSYHELVNPLIEPKSLGIGLPAIRIVQPTLNLRIAKDPRIPDENEVFRFQIAAQHDLTNIRWYLNNELIAEGSEQWLDWQVATGSYKLSVQAETSNGEILNARLRHFEVL
ncbi:MAG: transglycosylase domain-containing protein, partial [Kangiellaceae bacterium]|nr:transglycosylase domain-containing protein [Kangiellaceae bacterium]